MESEQRIFIYSDHTRFHFNYLTPPTKPDVLGGALLYQVGDLYATTGYQIGQHVQYCHEISYITSGEGEYSINGKWFPVQQGDIILSRKGELHDGVSSDKNPIRNYFLGFDIDRSFIHQEPYTDIVALFEQKGEILARGHPEVAAMYIGMFQELVNHRSCYTHMIEYYMLQLLITVCRIYLGGCMSGYNPERDADPNGKITHTIIQYIDANLEKIDRLTDLSPVFDYSYSHLSHIFKERMGMSIYQYYDRKRFDRAVELLQSDELNVTQVAERLRYQSLHAFTKAFGKRFGISPTEYVSVYHQRKKQMMFLQEEQRRVHIFKKEE